MLTMKYLQQLVKKYDITKGDNKTEVENCIYSLSSLYLSKSKKNIRRFFTYDE